MGQTSTIYVYEHIIRDNGNCRDEMVVESLDNRFPGFSYRFEISDYFRDLERKLLVFADTGSIPVNGVRFNRHPRLGGLRFSLDFPYLPENSQAYNAEGWPMYQKDRVHPSKIVMCDYRVTFDTKEERLVGKKYELVDVKHIAHHTLMRFPLSRFSDDVQRLFKRKS